jgi:hypothetical protein
MVEFAIVRMDRWEFGTKDLPVDDPRRCRYYIIADNSIAALKVASERWPSDTDIRIVGETEKSNAHD